MLQRQLVLFIVSRTLQGLLQGRFEHCHRSFQFVGGAGQELSLQFEAYWFPRLQQQGWKIKPLGLPTLLNGDWWIGATIPISEEVVRATRSFYSISGPLLVRRSITQPAIQIAA